MAEVTNFKPIISESDLNSDSLSESKIILEECFSKIKDFIVNLTKTNHITQEELQQDILSFSYLLLKIGNSLMNLELFDEQNKLRNIRNITIYILEDLKLFDKYSYFIIEMLDLFKELISHLEEANYNKDFSVFNKKLNKYETFFRESIFTYTEEDEKKVFMLTNEFCGS